MRVGDASARQVALAFSDVTARRQSEADLRDAKARLEATLAATEVATWIWDVREDRVFADENLARLFSVNAGDARGGRIERYFAAIHPEDRARVQAGVDEAMRSASGRYEIDYRLVQAGGSVRWVSTRGRAERNPTGEVIRFPGVALDVTERKHAEELARETGDQYRMLFNSLDAGFCVLGLIFDEGGRPRDYRYLEINQAFEAQTRPPNALGRSARELMPDHEDHWIETYGNVALTGQSRRYENYAEALDRWFNVFAFRVGSPEKQTVAVLFTDVTERRRAADALRVAKEQAEAASRAKDHFLAALSHELRTPLTPVLMTAAALSEDERLPADVREQFRMVERNVALESRLIDDLLDLTRITHGKLAVRAEPCDAHSLLGLAVGIVRDEAREKGHKIALDLRARHSHLVGDTARLQQVFWNLLRNAVKFTPAGGHIQVRSFDAPDAAGGSRLCIEVKADGIGFAPEAAVRIFSTFEQAAHGLERQFGGLGLGLAIARAIAHLHRGVIRAESPGRGQGATFTVELPGARLAADAPAATPTGRDRLAAGFTQTEPSLRLLVVEDHEPTRQVLARLLKRASHEVETAGSLAEALAAAAARPFDGVVSDLGLPDGTGNELMESLRERHGLRGIALSGYGLKENLRRSLVPGAAAEGSGPAGPDREPSTPLAPRPNPRMTGL